MDTHSSNLLFKDQFVYTKPNCLSCAKEHSQVVNGSIILSCIIP